MRIAIVCDVLGKENNGTTVAAMNLIRHLKAFGHDVRVLCADCERQGEEGFFVAPRLRLGKLLDAYVDRIGVTLAKGQERVVAEALKDVQLVHCMLPFELGRAALAYCKEHRIPISAGFHQQAENITAYLGAERLKALQRSVYRHLYRSFYRYVDAIHYPTQFVRDIFENCIGVKTNGYVISNGVDPCVAPQTIAKPPELVGRIVICSIGRYAREKSQDTLIRSIKYSKYKNQIQLILAGQGVRDRFYMRLAKKLPVHPIFRLFDRHEISKVLNYCDIYCHPAQIELEGIACLEAITCGKLTVVSDSPLSATKELAVDGRCVFRSRDPKDLARVLDYWIEHPEEKKETERKYLQSKKARQLGDCMRLMEQMFSSVATSAQRAQM